MASKQIEKVNKEADILPAISLNDEDTGQATTVSMVFVEPVDFSTPAPAFSADERIF
jgi:hypothetical protein